MFIIADEFTGVAFAHAASGGDQAGPPIKRGAWEKFLWGAAPEHCDDCGIEVKASEAIRYPGGRTYCSLAHAIESQDH